MEPEKDNLNPGSKEAVEKGCKCPVDDNKNIREGFFWISGECPIHREPEKKDVWEDFNREFMEIGNYGDDGGYMLNRLKNYILTHFISRAEAVDKVKKIIEEKRQSI